MGKPLFRFNTNSLKAAIQRELANEPKRARRAMDAVGGFLNGESKENAPVDEGFLVNEISNMTIIYNKSIAAVIYVPSNGQSSKYAIAMHEGHYSLGKNSLAKQSKLGRVVGRRFIVRAMDANISVIGNIIRSEMRV